MNILSIANFSGYNKSNTALHRHWALENLGTTDAINTNFNYSIINRIIKKLFKFGIKLPYASTKSFNDEIITKLNSKNYDVIWIDKGVAVRPSTLKMIRMKYPETVIIGYSPDEMTKRHNQSYNFLKSLPYYDYYVTTKSYAVEGLKDLGIKNVLFANNAYEEKFHFPYQLLENDIIRLGGEVGFIGAWEEERANSILHLAKNGIEVRVWGTGKWNEYKNLYPNLIIENNALFSEDYSKALNAFKINLCFLRKMNNDLQTTRTMEIPACGGFMVAERTSEHEELFQEGEEAEFFSSDDELLEKCRYYLEHNHLRSSIAKNGLERCLTSGYSNKETIQRILKICTER
ncbi:glycosyltransferase [Chryseobacterium sp. Leaf394]|uniref:CgeB family protein n=1 Tax=Chryseobacterium sp. Leaf394 TaxID=1736361 RepID=UPI0006F9D36A|nr:glycosyltransferase [Chryseobacterium sp. Leaf394]KQS93226.1 hypothetical protein ASG21_12640 [Chryseobacterium sp. Leaf394]